jgi:hypothetical protein
MRRLANEKLVQEVERQASSAPLYILRGVQNRQDELASDFSGAQTRV